MAIPIASMVRSARLVLDPHAPSSLLALAEWKDKLVRSRLARIAEWSTKSESEAEDLVMNALVRVLDPDDAPWVPPRPTFLAHMAFVMRQVWDQQMRKASAQREILDAGVAADERTASPTPRADDELERLREIGLWQRLLEEVLAKIGDKYPLTRQICDLAARGIEDPAEQAQSIGCDVEKIYRALETLQYHGQITLEEWNLAEQHRMRERREAATKKDEATP